MAGVRFKIKILGDATKYTTDVVDRTSPRHLMHIQQNIVGRVVHAAVVHNFYVEGARRRSKWAPLSPIYKKIKETTKNIPKAPMKQPTELGGGRYRTPYGNINVRTGALFNSLGTIFRVTPNVLTYGTTNPYAKKVMEGHTVRRIDTSYQRFVESTNSTITVKYRKDLKKPVRVPARPFNFIAKNEEQAISDTIAEYFAARRGRRTVLIPPISPRILGPGGRRVYILFKR